MMKCVFIVVTACSVLSTNGQIFPATNYPKKYFGNPLNIPITLAGNFGELRPNHYHMGLDIKTQKRENLPVYASADGYIAQVKVEPAGFGQAIYINHPNGYTTLYAHLNAFFPALAEYVKAQQYKAESWKILISIPPGMFPVKKGTFIAYSGSTGGSEAPHVHFEIRKTASDINLNPMLFGLPIQDKTAPVIFRLALYDRNKSIYEQSPRLLPVRKVGNDYVAGAAAISASSKASFGISAFDTNSGSANRNGIFDCILYDNDHPVTGFEMNTIGYDNTRNVNAHIDYKTKATGGPFIQQVFQLYGYVNSIYHNVSGDGTIDLSDGLIHSIKIVVKDPYGNQSQLRFRVQHQGNERIGIQAGGKMFYPQMLGAFESSNCAFYIGERCLYDSVHIQYNEALTEVPGACSNLQMIGKPYIPVQDSFLVRIRPNLTLDDNKKTKIVMLRSGDSRKVVQKVVWQGGWASAKFRDFGSFQLLLDETPPVIIPVGFTDGADLSQAAKIVFIVKDNLDQLKNFRAELDGKWLCFSNDKGRSFVYKFDNKCIPGKHELKISVEDEAGNKSIAKYTFIR